MRGEAVHQRIRAYAAEHGVSYREAFGAVVYADDAGATVKAYQRGAPSAADLLSRLLGGLDRPDRMDGATVDRLRNEAERLREILTSPQDRDRDLVAKTEAAVAGLLEAIAGEERRRRETAPKLVEQTLGGFEYVGEEPPADRLEAGRRLDALGQGHMRSYGTDYATAFRAVSDQHPALRRAYGSLEGAA